MILFLLPQMPPASSLDTEGERRGELLAVTTPALKTLATGCSPQHLDTCYQREVFPRVGAGQWFSWSLGLGGGGVLGSQPDYTFCSFTGSAEIFIKYPCLLSCFNKYVPDTVG